MKSVQEYIRQLLQTVPTSKMLQVPLCLDALFEHFKQSANKTKSKMSVKKLHCTALIQLLSITKAMDGLFKYNIIAPALSLWGNAKTVHFIARA